MSIADNIKRIRRRADMSQSEFGEIAGTTYSAVSQWENGRAVPRMDAVDAIAKHFGLSRSDILGEDTPPIPNRRPVVGAATRLVPVRRLGTVHAGPPTDADDLDAEVSMPAEVVERHPGSFALRVEGDCMERTVPPGYDVLVDPAAEARSGSVVVARVEDTGEHVMRRLIRGNTGGMLVSDSCSTYPDLVFGPDERVELVGVVVWAQRDLEA